MSLEQIKELGVLPDAVAEDLFTLLRQYNENKNNPIEGNDLHE